MKGGPESNQVLAIVLALVLLAIGIWWIMGGPIATFRYETFEGLAGRIPGHIGTPDLGVGSLSPMRLQTNNDLRKIDRDDDHYISEVACTIAEDIYYDFTKYGERGRDGSLSYTGPSSAFDDEAGCEWFWNFPCCPARLAVDLRIFPNADSIMNLKGWYKCLINHGIFSVNYNEALPSAVIDELEDLDCSTDCVDATGDEFVLDEVCVNSNFAKYVFPDPSDISFCTDEMDEYLMIDYVSDRERQKFGNKDCYANSRNTYPGPGDWASQCNCEANGQRETGESITDRDENRLQSWKIDIVNDDEESNDKGLMKLSGTTAFTLLPKRKYFYTLYWNNNDENDDDFPNDDIARGYEVEFPGIITKEFTDITRTFTRAEFLDFITEFFDEEEDIRISSAGRWFPELRTQFDGMVTVNSEVVITDILDELEILSISNFVSYEEICTRNRNCLNYNVDALLWEENLGRENNFCILPSMCDGKEWPFSHRTPVNVKHTKNIDKKLVSGGTYRVIIRNWASNWYGWQENHCDIDGNGAYDYWCYDESKKGDIEGEGIIYCSQTGGSNCRVAFLSRLDQPLEELNYYRYADQNVIIIKLPDCDDGVDGGLEEDVPSTVTVDDQIIEPVTYDDKCVSGTVLNEYYCSDAGEAVAETITCTNTCEEDAQGRGYCT